MIRSRRCKCRDDLGQRGVASGVSPPPGGLRRIGSARWRRRNLTFDKISFFLVFLVIPVAFYIGFVVSPFVQAAYFSLTDWTGFTPAMNFIGLSNYAKLFTVAPSCKPWATTF